MREQVSTVWTERSYYETVVLPAAVKADLSLDECATKKPSSSLAMLSSVVAVPAKRHCGRTFPE